MKYRIMTVLLIVLLLAALPGCSVLTMGRALDRAEDVVEDRLDAAEDAVEQIVEDSIQTAAPPAATQPSATTGTAEKLTKEQAQAIALADAGFTAEQVTGLRTEYEIDDGIPRYEVKFREGRWEYDYEIHAETGKILSFDRDD